MLTVVQAVARISFGTSNPEGLQDFDRRLRALSEANRVLTHGHLGERPFLRKIILDVAHAMEVEERVFLHGPDAELRPSAGFAYTLAFHELFTNAIKHGSLSGPIGTVEVTWSIFEEAPEHIHVIWRELGGPPVIPPERQGFGSRLISKPRLNSERLSRCNSSRADWCASLMAPSKRGQRSTSSQTP
jgi:two-component sensor histidine kinase